MARKEGDPLCHQMYSLVAGGVLLGGLLHILHNEKVLIDRHIGGGVYGSKLVLRGGSLVVLGLGVYSERPERDVKIAHKRADP